MFKKDDGKPQLVDRNSKGCIKTLVSTYHKIQRLTGTFVKDGNTGIRLLSQNECKAIMGFPKNFVMPVSRTQMYRQLGNSVAIPVVEAIAKEMIKSIYSLGILISDNIYPPINTDVLVRVPWRMEHPQGWKGDFKTKHLSFKTLKLKSEKSPSPRTANTDGLINFVKSQTDDVLNSHAKRCR